MFSVIKWVFWGTIWVLVLAVFHYTLPQVDIVRVTDTYEKRIDFGENSIFWASADVGNDGTAVNRDVFFIQTRRAKGDVMVYRNEDTGWGWPPYFKFDSSNLDTEAQDLVSTAQDPEWAIITHYGWRIKLVSVFPNAVSIRPIEVPAGQSAEDYRPFPWLNLIIFAVMIVGFLFVRAAWRQFRERTVDPLADKVGDQYDHVSADLSERKGRVSRWLGTWRKK